MNLSDLVPKFRFEIRRAGSTKRDPWQIAELAHTQNQVTAMTPHWKNNPDLEFRVVDNLPAAPQPVRLDPLAPLPAAAPVAKFTREPVVSISTGPAAASTAATIDAAAATPAAAVLAPLPFKTGDQLQDKNVDQHLPLFVAELNPDGRHGFNVEMPAAENPAHRGWFVPAASAGAFHLFGAHKSHAAASHAPARKSRGKQSTKKKTTAAKHKAATSHS